MATNKILRKKYKEKQQENPKIIWTIKQLFEWAVKNGCEDYLLHISDDEGTAIPCFIDQINIDYDSTEVYL